MRVLSLLCLAALLMAAGCASSESATFDAPELAQSMPVDPPSGSRMLTANTHAGDALHKMLLLRMGSSGGILSTSFVDMDNIDQTSAFGRLTSQQVASRIGQYGFRVIEPRLANTLIMASGTGPESGEFMLSRETSNLLRDTYDAHAVLVGFYTAHGDRVFVSARVVRLADSAVMGAYEYYLPRKGEVGGLLASSAGGAAGGDNTVWLRYSSREQAFPSGSARSAGKAPTYGGKAESAAGGVSSGSEISRAVPRHVSPTAEPKAKGL